MIGPVGELSDAMSVEHDGFDVAVIDINLRGNSAYPIADRLMGVRKPFGYGAETIPHRFRHVPRWEKPYELDKVAADIGELCVRQVRPVAA